MKEVRVREAWLDLIKVIATFLVIILHAVNNGIKSNESDISLVIYYLGVFAIPLFFMVNGYLQLNKEKDYKYVFKKIGNILIICFSWNIFVFIYKLIVNHNISNIFIDVYNNFLQDGFFWHFWFLGSLIIIYLFLPLLQRLFKDKKRAFIITICLMVICSLIDILNIYLNHHGYGIIRNNVHQVFRLWTWFTYYFIGGCLYKITIYNKKVLYIGTIVMILLTIGYEYLFSYKLYTDMYAESFYDSLIVMITSILIFLSFKMINVKTSGLTKLGVYMMGVYIIHPIFIYILSKTNMFYNNYMNFIWSANIFMSCLIISYIMAKIPIINRMIKI